MRKLAGTYRKTRGPRWKWPFFIRILFVAMVFFGLGAWLSAGAGFWKAAGPLPPRRVRLGIDNVDN